MNIRVLRCRDYGRTIHIYNPETDKPVCNSPIKRENWELLTMDYNEWFRTEWHCWNCPWSEHAIKKIQPAPAQETE